MSQLPPPGTGSQAIGAGFALFIASMAIWAASGQAPALIETCAAVLNWVLVAGIVSHILFVLYCRQKLGVTKDNPYTQIATGRPLARRLNRIGRVLIVVYLGALLVQEKWFLTVLLVALIWVNWSIQMQVYRSAQAAGVESE